MPVKPETKFYRRINDKIPADIHRQKIGSLYANGTPDFWYSGNKADIWVEYKWLSKLPRGGVDPLKLLSPLQARWLNDRLAEGRAVVVIIGSPEGCAIAEKGRWNHPIPASAFLFAVPAVSEYLTERLYVSSAVP